MHVNTLRALADDSSYSDIANDWLTTLKNATGIYQQNQVFNAQLSTAKAAGTPVVNPSTGQVVTQQSSNMKNILLLGGAAALGVLLFSMMRRRR